MKLSSRLLPLLALFGFVLATLPVCAEDAIFREATISLGRDPEPPFCVNPSAQLTITWSIEHETTPNYVLYEMWDPSQTILIETQTYPGGTGLDITRYWTCPANPVTGKYWIRVEYWSYEAGNEANAEVTFYVCSGTGSICATKWEDIDCSGDISTPDVVLPGWWICLVTPYGDTYCLQTDDTGTVCWDGLMLGDYTVFEVLQAGYVIVAPASGSYDVTLTQDEPDVAVTFLNKTENSPSPVDESTWGKLKSRFR
jgi:hypothetical protein